MADISQTITSLFGGMDQFISSKSVVGEPITVGDTIIIPLMDVNFGVGAGVNSTSEKNKQTAGGAMGGKMSPTAVLVIQNGRTKMIPVKDQDALSKVLDMIPDVVDKVTDIINKKMGKEDPDAEAVAEKISSLEDEEF